VENHLNQHYSQKFYEYMVKYNPRTKKELEVAMARFCLQEGFTIEEVKVWYYALVSTGSLGLIEG